ncbi:MAG: phosphatidate cytidylyltransferase [Candidatus Pelethousia sp.]|nr:phosphatidate cytidylyltransferase [Candidatus Pelethousia sp.]
MKTRILVGAGLLLLFAAILFFGGWFQVLAFTAAAVISVHEMGKACGARGYHPCLWPLYIFTAFYYLAYANLRAAWLGVLALCCLLALCAERIFNPLRTTEDTICSLFVFVYPVSLYVTLAMVASLSKSLLLLCFAAPLMGDTAAFFVGSTLGKHKLCPHISPKKTVEGSVGGFLGGALGGMLTWALQGLPGLYSSIQPGLWQLALAGLLCGGVGQIGDLFASTVKRWADIKDYGNIFPGHGGVMDRLDSVLMCAPLVYVCMLLLWLL